MLIGKHGAESNSRRQSPTDWRRRDNRPHTVAAEAEAGPARPSQEPKRTGRASWLRKTPTRGPQVEAS